MTIQQAIEKAVKSGYDGGEPALRDWHQSYGHHRFDEKERILLDPLFWQSLGKAMGWEDEKVCPTCWKKIVPTATGWMCYWHRFIDHIAEWKDAESFFDSLDK